MEKMKYREKNMENLIKIGDRVDVHFENLPPIINATVTHIPSEGVEWFGILPTDTNIMYVKNFCYIQKRN